MRTSYDMIGVNYSDLRRPDARIEAVISNALGSARTVLNVGAGTGSYEPVDRSVTAIEPSIEMIRQRGALSAPVVQGFAENLPFDDNAFDASMAILTVHHWSDKQKGLQEMRRVTRGPGRHTDIRPFAPGVLACRLFSGACDARRGANAKDDRFRRLAWAGGHCTCCGPS